MLRGSNVFVEFSLEKLVMSLEFKKIRPASGMAQELVSDRGSVH